MILIDLPPYDDTKLFNMFRRLAQAGLRTSVGMSSASEVIPGGGKTFPIERIACCFRLDISLTVAVLPTTLTLTCGAVDTVWSITNPNFSVAVFCSAQPNEEVSITIAEAQTVTNFAVLSTETFNG